MIENIILEDIPDIVELGRLAHAESKYNHLPYSPNEVQKTFAQHIAEGLAIKLVKDGKIAGFFLANKSGFIFTDVPIALETCYYILPEHRGKGSFLAIMQEFERWAENRPQVTIVHFQHDNTKTYLALEKLGFLEAGRIYTRAI